MDIQEELNHIEVKKNKVTELEQELRKAKTDYYDAEKKLSRKVTKLLNEILEGKCSARVTLYPGK